MLLYRFNTERRHGERCLAGASDKRRRRRVQVRDLSRHPHGHQKHGCTPQQASEAFTLAWGGLGCYMLLC